MEIKAVHEECGTRDFAFTTSHTTNISSKSRRNILPTLEIRYGLVARGPVLQTIESKPRPPDKIKFDVDNMQTHKGSSNDLRI